MQRPIRRTFGRQLIKGLNRSFVVLCLVGTDAHLIGHFGRHLSSLGEVEFKIVFSVLVALLAEHTLTNEQRNLWRTFGTCLFHQLFAQHEELIIFTGAGVDLREVVRNHRPKLFMILKGFEVLECRLVGLLEVGNVPVVVLRGLCDGRLGLFCLSQLGLGLVKFIEQKVRIAQLKLDFGAKVSGEVDPIEHAQPTLRLLVAAAVECLLCGVKN